MVTVLHKVNPEANCRRFYRVAVESSLFDEITLTRAWGRIGGKRRQLAPTAYSDQKAATKAAEKIIREKVKKGYIAQ